MALVELVGTDAFLERWDVISGGRRSAEERIAAYYSLTRLIMDYYKAEGSDPLLRVFVLVSGFNLYVYIHCCGARKF